MITKKYLKSMFYYLDEYELASLCPRTTEHSFRPQSHRRAVHQVNIAIKNTLNIMKQTGMMNFFCTKLYEKSF